MGSADETAALGGNDRTERIRAITDECLKRWAVGETYSEQKLIEANLDLQPELEIALKKLRLITQSEHDHFSMQSAPQLLEETVVHEKAVASRGGMHIRCPHCRNPVELLVDSPFTDITCSTCGSSFSLISHESPTGQTPPLQSLGHFELFSRLGMGGFGTVWKAHDLELDRTVAIKIPRRGQLDPVAEEQFLREARVAAQLRHPNIVSIHEVGREEETVYIVSDFVRGVSLSDWLTARKPSALESAELLIKISHALHYAHDKGIVHRDLKPSNVMIDFQGEPYLLDFGLAKRDVGELTMTADGQVLGTPAYMSPEQAEGDSHHVDRRTDVYSMGVMLFELLTGELPFRGSAQMQIRQKVSEEAPSPRVLDPVVSRDLATICSKCLERDPNRRYPSASDLAEDLSRFTLGEPIRARPVSPLEKSLRWIKRNPWKATAAGLVVFLAIAGPIASVTIETLRADLATRYQERESVLKNMNESLEEKDGKIKTLNDTLRLLEGRASAAEIAGLKDLPDSRQRLLQLIANKSENFSREEAQNDDLQQRVYWELALAMVYDGLNRNQEAREYYQSAQQLLQTLVQDNRAAAQYAVALADNSRQLARIWIDDDRTEAIKNLDSSIDIQSQLTAEHSDARLSAALILTQSEMAMTQGVMGGLQHLQLSQSMSKGFSQQVPTDAVELYLLACYLTQREPLLVTHANVSDKK